jgi:hypothetical protein
MLVVLYRTCWPDSSHELSETCIFNPDGVFGIHSWLLVFRSDILLESEAGAT